MSLSLERCAAVAGPGCALSRSPIARCSASPSATISAQEILSAEAIADPPPFYRARSVAMHEGVIRDMVHRLKYNDRTDLGPWMARWILRAGSELLNDCDIIVPVPLHARRFWLRRFNQSAELARHLARLSGKPFDPDALKRVRQTRQQVGLGANAACAQCARRVQGAGCTGNQGART